MNASRITLSHDVAHQRSGYSKILSWMQEHPKQLRNTNAKRLAEAMTLDGYKTKSIQLYIQRMVNNQMLHKYGGHKRATYCINYLHKDIPREVLKEAPLEERLAVKRQLGSMNQGQYLDDEGCIITPAPEAPKNDKDQSTPAEEVEAKSAETNEVKVPMTVKRDGNTLNISINLTIKLN